jgi:uncharacterized protein (TIGR03437 family)
LCAAGLCAGAWLDNLDGGGHRPASDGLAPNTIGLYQFNVVVPNDKFVNFTSLTFTLGSLQGTQTLDIAVQ